jgi:hypothetical protein
VAVDAYSPEWAAAYRDEINRSDVYRQSSEGWEGTVGLVVLAEPDRNVPADLGVELTACTRRLPVRWPDEALR